METILTRLVVFIIGFQFFGVEERFVKKTIKGHKALEFLGTRPMQIGFFRKREVRIIDLRSAFRLGTNLADPIDQQVIVIVIEVEGYYYGLIVDHLYPADLVEVTPHGRSAGFIPATMTTGSFLWKYALGVVLRPVALVGNLTPAEPAIVV